MPVPLLKLRSFRSIESREVAVVRETARRDAIYPKKTPPRAATPAPRPEASRRRIA